MRITARNKFGFGAPSLIGKVTTKARKASPPAIVRFSAEDIDQEDTFFSRGDQLRILFDSATNRPPVATSDDINRLLSFSSSIGQDYVGRWSNLRELIIVIQSTNNLQSNEFPKIGRLTVRVKQSGRLTNAAGTSDASTSTSLPLVGSWGILNQIEMIFVGNGSHFYSDEDTVLPLDVQLNVSQSRPFTISLEVDRGFLQADDRSPSAFVTFTGRPEYVNTFLGSLQYAPLQGFHGLVTITAVVFDQAFVVDQAVIYITVRPINDKPSLLGPSQLDLVVDGQFYSIFNSFSIVFFVHQNASMNSRFPTGFPFIRNRSRTSTRCGLVNKPTFSTPFSNKIDSANAHVDPFPFVPAT
jgi:hypothetical protein